MAKKIFVIVSTLILMGSTIFAATQEVPHTDAPASQQRPPDIVPDWTTVVSVSRLNATLQVVVNPLMGKVSPVHDQVWNALSALHANYVRYVPWLPYPKLAVAELEPPSNGKTSWDFSLIDPYITDFLKANPQHPMIINFSTVPQWMFKTSKPVEYPKDPNKLTGYYTQGNELRDPSLKELSDYYARLVSWYTKGGFTDEYGELHESGHYFKFDYWEVLNEPDQEHTMTPQQYTARYDAIVAAILKVQPHMKFVGIALAQTLGRPDYLEYFLDPKNHKAGIPIDMISYHFYAAPASDQPKDTWQYTVFDQSVRFIETVKYVDSIRKRLSPNTGTVVDELGVIAPEDGDELSPDYVFKPIPEFYWNLCAGQYAYLYGELAKLGMDAAGESALMQLPGFFPSVSMMNWDTGRPNARYWALRMIRENFGPGDRIVPITKMQTVYVFGVVSTAGKRKLLLVNMRGSDKDVIVAGATRAEEEYVDESTEYGPPASIHLATDVVHLGAFSVAVVTLQQTN